MLVFLLSKKKNVITLIITKIEYVAIDICYTQVIWMKHTLRDYKLRLNNYPQYNNISTIYLTKNHIQYS